MINSLKEARLEVYFWQWGAASGFYSQLFNLIGKADEGNRERIRSGFPLEVQAWEQWFRVGQDEFFRQVRGENEKQTLHVAR